ncbi:hypothetical protein QAD02_000772 [Eretmocerus hayati]|uniref:Uncharacterized protein n=1 Tax=Eretmocerus hayati TaxID=131215 RepID=A0ACC2NFE7_9HYME|nr:hypothetical protein QAD02_000772 [Eretmocerus hayati]
MIDVLFETHKANKYRDNRGNRYCRGLQMFCAFLKMTAGRLVYEILSEVFFKSIPKCSAIDEFIRKESGKIVEGHFRVDEVKKFLVDRNLPLEVSMSEDACAIISKIQYDALTDQGVGIVLPIDGNSMPIPGSFPATTVRHIEKMFENARRSTLLYVYMVQPLSPDAPSFCVLMYGTDNKFTASDSINRRNHMAQEFEKRGIIVRFISSDGDPRLLKAHKIQSGLGKFQNPLTPVTHTINGETIVLPEYHADIKSTQIPTHLLRIQLF